jgi:hypothetical protein
MNSGAALLWGRVVERTEGFFSIKPASFKFRNDVPAQ